MLLALVMAVYRRRSAVANAVYTQKAAAGLSKKQRRKRPAELLKHSPYNRWMPELAEEQRAARQAKGYTRKQRRNKIKVQQMRRAKKSSGSQALCNYYRSLRDIRDILN